MRKIWLTFVSVLAVIEVYAQTPVVMANQPALTWQEDFDDIINWTNGFAAGNGAQHWSGLAPGGTGTIPNGTRITHGTTSFASSASSGGVHRDSVNGRIMLLATGTSDNTNAAAIDLHLDFTNIAAGTLSFDWASVNNGANTSNRKGSLRVYGSTDGVNFTEITAAQVLNITNYAPSSGTVLNVALPASFNNAATARLRFYYHNGTGGTTGSRPLIALDNIKVTASGPACSVPAASPTALMLNVTSATTVQGSFTAASPAPDEYLVVATANGSLTANPADSFVFNPGDNVGDGIVIYRGSNTSFTATGLNPQTTYTFFVFSLNIYCNGTIRYRSVDALSGTATTPAGPPCATPAAQPTGLQFSNVTTNSMSGSFTASGADEYLVIRSNTGTLGAAPVNGTVYNMGDALGNGTVVYRGGATSFTATGLAHSTSYHYFVFAVNSAICSNGPAYLTGTPLTGSQSTAIVVPCTTPPGAATNLVLHPGTDQILGFFNPHPAGTDAYLVVMSTGNTLSAMPQNGVVYHAGDNLGGGIVLSAGNSFSFSAASLAAATNYHFFVFSYNKECTGGPMYRTSSYLSGSAATILTPAYNFYFGNLHAHSSFSDGNKDNGSLTPEDDYLYAKNALCMDFLGISEHNHYTAANNPGMLLANYHQGIAEANSFTTANPGFLALYGMEWGTLNNGGHALVYGIDSLIGWETIGGSPNYNIFVTQNDFVSASGLFRKVNQFRSSNAFATLAHPSSSDFQNLAFAGFNLIADSAVAGVAVESGPAFSTNTSYSDPGSSMSFLGYWQQLLAKGYHVAPMIDHDNHNTTFGTTAYTRTAVISPSINKADFLSSMQHRRFYATQDCDTRAEIMVYGQQMGSLMTHDFAPAITVTAKDPTSSGTLPVIRLMYGIAGSGVLPVMISSDTGYVLHYTDHSLNNGDSAYYYADILINGNRTVTAPVWYKRTDNPVLAVDWSYFRATPSGGAVDLEWGTGKEQHVSEFVIERSGNGSSFDAIGRLTAKGSGAGIYQFRDLAPLNRNFYRIRENGRDGNSTYSNIVFVAFGQTGSALQLLNNPAGNSLELEAVIPVAGEAVLTLITPVGQIITRTAKPLPAGVSRFTMGVAGLPAGVYLLIFEAGSERVVRKFLKQ